MSKRKICCSICGSPGVNKSSCPLYIQNPTKKNWIKHLHAKKPTSKPSTTKVSKVATVPPSKKYSNPYTPIMQNMCNMVQRLIPQIKPNLKIVLTGKILQVLQFKINNSRYKIEISNTLSNRKKLSEYLRLFCDIHRQLQSLQVNRMDFFTNPSAATRKILQLRDSAKALFIKFLIDNINPSGGTPEHIDIHQPVDELLETIQLLETMDLLETLPLAPTGNLESNPVAEQKIAIPVSKN